MNQLIRYFIFLSLLTACYSNPRDKFEDAVITLNGNVLTGFEFSKRLVKKFIEQDVKYPKHEIIAVFKKQVVEDFIIQSLFNDYAREKNILVKKEILDEEFKKFRQAYPDQDSFEIFLNESGQNKSTFRESLKDRITRDLVKTDLFSTKDFSVDAATISEYYNNNKDQFKREDQIQLKQILFESEEDGIKIQELIKKDKKISFETLASKYSLGIEKANGGDMGWVNTNSFSAFEEANKSSIGEITPIIKSENGFHIFKVVNKRKATTLPLKEVEGSINKQLTEAKQSEFLNEWIKNRVANSKLKVNEKLISKITVNRPTSL